MAGEVIDGLEPVHVEDQDASERAVSLAALLLPLEQQAPAAPVHLDAVLLRAADMSRDALFSAASWPGFVATSPRSWLSRPTCPLHTRGDQQDDGRRRAVGRFVLHVGAPLAGAAADSPPWQQRILRLVSDTSAEDVLASAEVELAEADRQGDAVRLASAQARWADAAELRAEDLERAGQPVPDALLRRIARYREDTAAG